MVERRSGGVEVKFHSRLRLGVVVFTAEAAEFAEFIFYFFSAFSAVKS